MNTSNITKSALALALGLCATGAWATVTNTNAFENFTSGFSGGINNVTQNGFTWTAGADAAAYSSVNGNGKLVVDTGDSVITGALASAQADDFTGKMAGHNAKFSAKVAFTPVAASAADPGIDTTNLKFALFAKDNGSSTNLYVVKSGSATAVDTTIDINARSNDSEKLVEVVFTANNTFTVAIDGGTPSTAYTFYSGTGINQVEFQGNGEVDDVGFTYELAAVSVTITGDTSNLTAAWEVDDASVGSAPATLTEGQTYSVTFTAASGYAIKEGETTTFSGTAATTAISIAAPLVEELPSYAAGDKPVEGEGGSGYPISAEEATYLNALVGTKGAAAVETALDTISAEDFSAAVLLNQDITEGNPGSYSFDITKISKSGSTVTVTASLVRKGTVIGAINGTATLYSASTPALLESAPTKQSQTFSLPNAEKDAPATASVTFTGADKFFKVVIE